MFLTIEFTNSSSAPELKFYLVHTVSNFYLTRSWLTVLESLISSLFDYFDSSAFDSLFDYFIDYFESSISLFYKIILLYFYIVIFIFRCFVFFSLESSFSFCFSWELIVFSYKVWALLSSQMVLFHLLGKELQCQLGVL